MTETSFGKGRGVGDETNGRQLNTSPPTCSILPGSLTGHTLHTLTEAVMRKEPDVEIISRIGRFAITDDKQRLPITEWFDADGDECEPEAAVCAVAGPTDDGAWLSIDLRLFEYGNLN